MSHIQFADRRLAVGKVLCVGRNYVEHIQELDNRLPEHMVLFHKPSSAVTTQLRSFHQEPLHYEAEICFVVEQGQYVGVGVGLDLTKRELQTYLKQQGLPWERAKAFDGAAVLSRFIPLAGLEIRELNLELLINCVRVQKGHVQQMLYSPSEILQQLKSYLTLDDGDVVMTGTPQGVGVVQAGDRFVGRLKCAERTLLEVEWIAD